MLLTNFGSASAALHSPQQIDNEPLEPLLLRYIEGWAEVNILKLSSSVSEDYLLVDPLVGIFGRNAISQYVAILRDRVGFCSVPALKEKVHLGRIRSGLGTPSSRRFWRSLPECGLAGTSDIALRGGRVARETLSYDLNIATEQLRRPAAACAGHSASG
jgi:hypothetical protein